MAPPPRKRTSMSSSSGPVTSNFRPVVEKGRWAAKGTLPLPEPSSVTEILTKVILHGCRKVLFIEPKIRLMVYGLMLFCISLVADYAPFPRSYFAAKDNVLNVYFVKFSWGWTMILCGMFMYLTCSTYCCGNRERTVRHMLRLGIATLVWYTWTTVFEMVEGYTGQCMLKEGTVYSIKNRRTCFSKSGIWNSLDISGHSFLLIWCVLFMMEEAKAIVGWDNIKDHIRNEEYYRGRVGQQGSTTEALPETCLNVLSEEEFVTLKTRYNANDIPAKIVLIGMTVLCLIWDLMILMTAVYFHVMIEKVLGGLAAVITWFIIYRGIYKSVSYFILPGQGLFKYSTEPKTNVTKGVGSQPSAKSKSTNSFRQKGKETGDDLPKFMGMPLYALRNAKKDESLSQSQIES